MDRAEPKRLVYLVVCAAPPGGQIAEMVNLLQRDGWTICVIGTPKRGFHVLPDR
jgi:hypothetical protein